MGSTVYHPPCGKRWAGLKPEHCPACCETFSGTRAGDLHRKGPHGARECAAPADVGLVYDETRQMWRFPADDRTPW